MKPSGPGSKHGYVICSVPYGGGGRAVLPVGTPYESKYVGTCGYTSSSKLRFGLLAGTCSGNFFYM